MEADGEEDCPSPIDQVSLVLLVMVMMDEVHHFVLTDGLWQFTSYLFGLLGPILQALL